jgi:plasmid stabilization system protein ParE
MVKRKLKINWDNEAKKSLRNIYNYIKGRESVEVAKKVRNEISSQAKFLNDFPEKFEKEHNLDDGFGNYRYKVIWSYKIIYEITKEAIYILDIFHTSRDPSNIRGLP